jgi:hypothetical protein
MPAVDAGCLDQENRRQQRSKGIIHWLLATRFLLSITIYSTINIDGFDVPPNFDDNKKYPVIFHVQLRRTRISTGSKDLQD